MSLGGGGSSRQTTTQEPPAYLRPFLQEAMGGAQNLYRGGPQQYFPGETVTPFSQDTQTALQMARDRATGGSQVTQNAQGYAADVLGGKYLGGNPHTDAAFGRAALATQNQLSSEFGRAGRNIGASEGLRGQQLNDLATQFYYQDYNNERARMQNTLPVANSLANQDYTDIAQLGSVGSRVEDLNSRQIADAASRWDFNQNAPGMNLDQYLGRLQGYPGGIATSVTPTYRNPVAGGAGGALLGYNIGNQFGYGGVGAGIGGLLGAFG